jgi:hypothetical protein
MSGKFCTFNLLGWRLALHSRTHFNESWSCCLGLSWTTNKHWIAIICFRCANVLGYFNRAHYLHFYDIIPNIYFDNQVINWNTPTFINFTLQKWLVLEGKFWYTLYPILAQYLLWLTSKWLSKFELGLLLILTQAWCQHYSLLTCDCNMYCV